MAEQQKTETAYMTVGEVAKKMGVTVRTLDEPLEIVSLMGTVSEHGCHLHASFSRADLSAFGGHLLPGCIVNTTAEIVLAEIPDRVFTRQPDGETGYDELVIRQEEQP